MNGETAMNDALVDLARGSWKTELLQPPDPDLVMSRPLMVLHQGLAPIDEDVPAEQWAEQLREKLPAALRSSMQETASFSQDISTGNGECVFFFIAAHRCFDSPWQSLLSGMLDSPLELFGQSVSDIVEAPDLVARLQPGEDASDEITVDLMTVVVLPDPEDGGEYSLADIEETIPGFDDSATFFDPDDGMAKHQHWESGGERDTGYLWALEEGHDTEDYEDDGEVGRQAIVDLLRQGKAG